MRPCSSLPATALIVLQFVLSFVPLATPPVQAQASLSASTTPSIVHTWTPFDIELTLDAPEDLFFLGFTMRFPSSVMKVRGVAGVGDFSGGLTFHETFRDGSEGVSISRTGAGGVTQAGVIARITLLAAGDVAPGQIGIAITSVMAANSSGDPLVVQLADTVHVTFKESINQLKLVSFHLSDTISITEGDSQFMVGEVEAAGITMDSSRVGRMQVYLGVYPVSGAGAADPAAWPSDAWLPMAMISDPRSSFWNYRAESAWRLEPGDHHIALKGVLDGTDVYYGGIGGLLNEYIPDSRMGVLRVGSITPGRFTIAKWTFESQTLLPVDFIEENRTTPFGYSGVTLTGYSSDGYNGNGFAVSARSWHDEGIEKYWQAKVALAGLTEVEVSSQQISSDTGPAIFMMQTRDQNGVWQDHADGLRVLDSRIFSFASIEKAQVPSAHLVNDSLHVRWLMYMDERVSGGDVVSSSGTSRIDNVLITGRNVNGQRLELWPGDTDNDGVVRAEDVLPLGVHWERRGPRPVYGFTSFEKRVVSSWMPLPASYADANGDGQVDHLDLQPIGLHFGRTVPGAKGLADDVEDQDAGPVLRLPALMRGQSHTIEIRLDGQGADEGGDGGVDGDGVGSDAAGGDADGSDAAGGDGIAGGIPQGFSGVAGVISWSGADASALQWEWASDLQPEMDLSTDMEPSLLTFGRQETVDVQTGRFHMASVVKRPTREQRPSRVGVISVKAMADIPEGLTIRLDRLTLVTRNGEQIPYTARTTWTIGLASSTSDPSAGAGMPFRTRLLANYPNPFNPQTMIPFELAEPGVIRLTLHDLLGRQIALIEEGLRGAGSHVARLDASRLGLSSGLYLVRLQTPSGHRSMPVTLAK